MRLIYLAAIFLNITGLIIAGYSLQALLADYPKLRSADSITAMAAGIAVPIEKIFLAIGLFLFIFSILWIFIEFKCNKNK